MKVKTVAVDEVEYVVIAEFDNISVAKVDYFFVAIVGNVIVAEGNIVVVLKLIKSLLFKLNVLVIVADYLRRVMNQR